MATFRLSPKAVTQDLITAFDSLPPLTERERERVYYALRFIHPNIIERIEAEACRKVLRQINQIT